MALRISIVNVILLFVCLSIIKSVSATITVAMTGNLHVESFPDLFSHYAPKEKGKLAEKTLLVLGNPLNGCKKLEPPPDSESYRKLGSRYVAVDWIVLINDLGCNLRRKIYEAERNGYSGVIVYSTNSNTPQRMEIDERSAVLNKVNVSFVGYDTGVELRENYVYDREDDDRLIYRIKFGPLAPSKIKRPQTQNTEFDSTYHHRSYAQLREDALESNRIVSQTIVFTFLVLVIIVVILEIYERVYKKLAPQISDNRLRRRNNQERFEVERRRRLVALDATANRVQQSQRPPRVIRPDNLTHFADEISTPTRRPNTIRQHPTELDARAREFLVGLINQQVPPPTRRRQQYSETQIRTLPTFYWAPNAGLDDMCHICMDDYNNADCLMSLPCPTIRHYFHEECILHWLAQLEQEQCCPMCRGPVSKHFENEPPQGVEVLEFEASVADLLLRFQQALLTHQLQQRRQH